MAYSFFAGVYDALTANVGYSRRAEYFCSLLSENGIDGGLLLDLACGTGSLSAEFAKRGYNVTGVDLSEEMLSVAQQKAIESNLNILFLCQDMRSLDLYGTMDCAVCALDSINHLTEKSDVQKTFLGVSMFMNDGGLFIFDVNTVYKHQNILADNAFVFDCDDVFCAWQNSLEDDKRTVNINLDFFVENENGEYSRQTECFSERAYAPEEITDMLCEAGFTVISQFDELTENAPDAKSERIVFVARRNNR